MQIKYYDRPGYIAWSNSKNHSQLLASASINEEDGFYTLDILELDLQQRSKKINVIGSSYTNTAFRCLAWDNFGQKQNTYPSGLIFTGMDDGSFRLWNPEQMISTYATLQSPSLEAMDSQTSLVYEEQPDEGAFPIMCSEWNSLKNNFLAFGGTDVLILDVGKDAADPQLVKPGKKNPHANSYVTSVSWNRQVAHILASASENGLVALWDIKVNNCIFNFKDSGVSSGNRNVVICWSKSISTQIAVTLDDEKRNELQIWDLRNQKGPVVVIDKVHTKGINAMDWCETDSELVLTASRDNRLACWNYTQEEAPLSESATQGNVFEVKWSKKLPSIYAVSGEDKTAVYTLSDNLFGYVPKWYKVSVGATLLGSEASLTYSEQRGPVLYEAKLNHQSKNSDIKAGLKVLGKVLEGIFDQSENDSELSILLKAKSSSEADSGIYEYLGLSKEKIVQEVQKYTGKKRQFAGHNKSTKEKSMKPKPKAYTQIQGQDALAFFAEIGSKTFEPAKQQDEQNNEGEIKYDMIPRNFNWDMGKERLVKQNILIGNYEGAIDAALKCGRTAEALIIAFSVDQNLFSTTLKTFFTETTDNFITDVLKNIAYRDPLELVNKYDLQKWKECIALIYSMSSRDKRPHLLQVLAQRLIQETEQAECEKEAEVIAETYAPVICCVLADDFAKVAQIYTNNLKLFKSGSPKRKKAAVEYARRLVAIYDGLTVQVENCNDYYQLLRETVYIAIEEGQKVIAHSVATRIPNSTKIIDYLVSNTKELQKYKSSVNYKVVVLPVMQSKKVEKKTAKTEQANPKSKKQPIFPPKEDETVRNTQPAPPPPGGKRKIEQDPVAGFSPYTTNPSKPLPDKPVAPIKKNLNNPPPPPAPIKKVHPQPVQEQPEQERQPIHKPQPQPHPPKKTQPPPPPPPSHQHNQSFEEEPKQAVKTHGKQGPLLPPPHVEKKAPPPVKQNSPPPPPPPRHEEEHIEEKIQPQQTPIKKKTPPPPPPPPPPSISSRNIPEPDHIPAKEEEHQPPQPPPKRNIPPARVEETKPKLNLPPGPKLEEKREAQYEEPVRKILPPPPGNVKKSPPPPPVRRG